MFSRRFLIGWFLYGFIDVKVKTFLPSLLGEQLHWSYCGTMVDSWGLVKIGGWFFFFSFCLNPVTSTERFPLRDFPVCASLTDNRKNLPRVPPRSRRVVMFYFLDLIAVNSCVIQRLYSLFLSTWHLPHYPLLPLSQTRTKPKRFLVGSREKWQRRSHGGAAVSSDHVTVRGETTECTCTHTTSVVDSSPLNVIFSSVSDICRNH